MDDAPTAAELAGSQAALNEYVACMIMGDSFNEWRYLDRAVTALTNHNLAAGFGAEFASRKPPVDLDERQRWARAAVDAVHSMDLMSRRDAARARIEADNLQRWAPVRAALPSADGAALVYLITHAELGAAKVGISDTAGLRLAQHRRKGWQILAVFQVTAKAAMAIEADVLKWWRAELALPSFLRHNQMPQGGWTETVAAGSVDLAATVTRICSKAVAAPPPASRPQVAAGSAA